MVKEFNLSEKIWEMKDFETAPVFYRALFIKDVKESIKKLKDAFEKGEKNLPITTPVIVLNYNKIIDEIFGEELSK